MFESIVFESIHFSLKVFGGPVWSTNSNYGKEEDYSTSSIHVYRGYTHMTLQYLCACINTHAFVYTFRRVKCFTCK